MLPQSVHKCLTVLLWNNVVYLRAFGQLNILMNFSFILVKEKTRVNNNITKYMNYLL